METKWTPRIVESATLLHENSRFCTCCERPLRGMVAWLELPSCWMVATEGDPLGNSSGAAKSPA